MDMDMDDDDSPNSRRMLFVFRMFVCSSLVALLGLQVYGYLWGLEGDFSDIKYVVMQLSESMSEVNQKHKQLRTEIERVASALPAAAAATGRAKEALQTRRLHRDLLDLQDYDHKMVDYALESAGARVLNTGDTVEYALHASPVSYVLHALSSWMCRECMSARALLRPGSLPGECWAFKGPRGEATILLLGTVVVTAVSLEHIPPHIAPTKEISSAPRVFQLEGMEFRTDLYPHDFGSFEYNKDGKPIQYFEVRHPLTKGFNVVRLRVLSNWGNPVFTCVYRLRVHGELDHRHVPHQVGDDGDPPRIDNE